MLRLRYGVSLGIVVFALQAFAADPDNGERLAQRWCAACHVVTPAQTSTTTDQAPPFPVIAKKPGFDAAKIALFLLDPHLKMPDMGLSRKEATDLAALYSNVEMRSCQHNSRFAARNAQREKMAYFFA